jgi:hypothetical protein
MARLNILFIADLVVCSAAVSHIRPWFRLSVTFISFLKYYKYRLDLFAQDVVKCRLQVNEQKYKNLVTGIKITMA